MEDVALSNIPNKIRAVASHQPRRPAAGEPVKSDPRAPSNGRPRATIPAKPLAQAKNITSMRQDSAVCSGRSCKVDTADRALRCGGACLRNSSKNMRLVQLVPSVLFFCFCFVRLRTKPFSIPQMYSSKYLTAVRRSRMPHSGTIPKPATLTLIIGLQGE